MARDATLRVKIITDADGRGVDQTDTKLGAIAGKAKMAGAAIGIALVAGGKKAIDAASAVEQAAGGMASVFGASADQVMAKAKGAATAVGLSTASYGQLATLLGAQLKNMGTAADQLAPQTDKLIGLGADLAATFGGSVSDAVSAVSSLLKGERDPIERYGVSLKQADIEARKAAMGLAGLTGEADRNATAQATLALLSEQTAAAQGQFARESETAAGSQAIAAASAENLAAKIGGALLPAWTALTTWLADSVIPALSSAWDWLAAKLGPAASQVGAWIQTNLVPALSAAWTWLQAYIIPVLATAWSGFQKVAGAVGGAAQAVWPLVSALGELFGWVANKVGPVLSGALSTAFNIAAGAASVFWGALSTVAGWLGTVIGWIDKAIGKLQSFISWANKAADVEIGTGGGTMQMTTNTGMTFGGAAGPAADLARRLTAASGAPAAGSASYPSVATDVDVVVRIGDEPIAAIVDRRVRTALGTIARRSGRPAVIGGTA